MKLLVGLGNHGEKYEKTRHNIGFVVMDTFISKCSGTPFKKEKKFFASISYGHMNHEKVILVKPETYMNASGKAITAVRNFYKIPVEDIIIFFDDVDTPFGEIRFRRKGSSGGHNGIKSVIQTVGSDAFSRIKFGIKNEHKQKIDTADFVLQKFSPEEWEQVPDIVEKGIQLSLENL